MRLVTFETDRETRLGAEWNDRIVDLQRAQIVWGLAHTEESALGKAIPPDMLGFLNVGPIALDEARKALAFLEKGGKALEDLVASKNSSMILSYSRDAIKLKAPIPSPPKIICLGLNYRDHAAESGAEVPTEPILFSKYTNAIVGPGDPILLPPTSQEVDYEAELVFVIGRGGKNIPESQAMQHVAGYTCGNDVSARDYQLKRGGNQWMVGKTFDTFGPIGPALVTADEIPDPHSLPIRCILNDETLQNSNTSQMVFGVPQIVAYLSHVMTLEPGDVIFTGTPPGVGFARKPPIFLKSGDVVEIQIDGVGSLRNPVRAA